MAAIYMWFQIYEEEYTTTLYALESDDGLLMSADLGDDSYMAPIDEDKIQFNHELVAVSTQVLLLSAPEQGDEIQFNHELVDIVVTPLLLAAPEQNDDIQFNHELVDLVVDQILITTYQPDQGCYMTADLIPGSCYMTAV